MYAAIDWLSLSVKFDLNPEGENEASVLHKAENALADLLGDTVDLVTAGMPWQWSTGRTPYRASRAREDFGAMLFLSPTIPHSLLEITGRGCELLRDDSRSGNFLLAASDRLTRIDVACDMLTDVRPSEFVSQRDAGRFKAHSSFVSESGDTEYVGSRTSDRYARVYRYNPPHERAHLLRCEFVLKGENAKITARAIMEQGLNSVVVSLGEAYGWKHPVWQPEAVDAAILPVWRPERKEGKTLYWLADTIAPLIVRLAREGTIDVSDWTQIHVFTPMGLTVRIVRQDADNE